MRFKALFASALLVAAFTPQARADIYLWQDPVYKFQVSYPDSWYRQTPDQPETRLVVMAPHDRASCRVQAQADRRAVIYPKRYMQAAVNTYLDQESWWQEVAQFDNAQLLDMFQSTGVGQGDATMVIAGYTTPDGRGGNALMQAVMFSSLYGDMRYTIGCSSEAEKFTQWQPLFMSVIGSTTFDRRYQIHMHDLYWRDYSKDKQLILRQGDRGTARVTWGPFEWIRANFFQ